MICNNCFNLVGNSTEHMNRMSFYLQILAFIFLRVCSNSSVLPPYFPQYTPELVVTFGCVQGSEFIVLQKNNIFLHNSLKHNVATIHCSECEADTVLK